MDFLDELVEIASEIFIKFQKHKSKVSLSQQSQTLLDTIISKILVEKIEPKSRFEYELFEFCFRFSSQGIICNKLYNIEVDSYPLPHNIVTCFIYFLTYQPNYLEKQGISAFYIPEKTIVSEFSSILKERHSLVYSAKEVSQFLLKTLYQVETELPDHIFFLNYSSSKNLTECINKITKLEFSVECLNPLRPLIEFDRYEPVSWGHSLWQMIHFISFLLYFKRPDEIITDDRFYEFLLKDLYRFLPCDLCGKSWVTLCKGLQLNLTNYQKYLQIYNLHNQVRNEIGLATYSLESFITKDTAYFKNAYLNIKPK